MRCELWPDVGRLIVKPLSLQCLESCALPTPVNPPGVSRFWDSACSALLHSRAQASRLGLKTCVVNSSHFQRDAAEFEQRKKYRGETTVLLAEEFRICDDVSTKV